jgi:hypothetical protein
MAEFAVNRLYATPDEIQSGSTGSTLNKSLVNSKVI